ncbi:hypothetical protein N7535_006940, partial [Penicillium sp. DV-2018c]
SHYSTSCAFSKASAHALSFCSASEASSPFSGSTSVDRPGFFKSSHRVGGPTLCSLPGRVTTSLPARFQQISRTAEERARDILQHLSLEFISSQHIKSEKNVLMLDSQLHTESEFGQFRLIFEATGVAQHYRIKTFPDTATGPIRYVPKNRLVRFRVHKGNWELPDPKLLEIHACIGNVLHISGQAEIIDKLHPGGF